MRALRDGVSIALFVLGAGLPVACQNPGPRAAESERTTTHVLGDPLRDVYLERDRGQYDAAIAEVRRILGSNPTPELRARALDALASVHWRHAQSRSNASQAREDRDAAVATAGQAVAAAREAANISPELLATYGLRYGQYLEAEARWNDAISQYESLVSTPGLSDAKRFELLLRLGAAHFQRADTLPAAEAASEYAAADERWQTAAGLLDTASLSDALRGELHFWRGLAAKRQRHPEVAVKELEAAVDLLPSDSELHANAQRNLILSLIDAGRYPEAAKRVETLKQATDPLALATRGYVQAALGNFAAARDDFALAENAARLDRQYAGDTAFHVELAMQQADCAVGLRKLADAQRILNDAWKAYSEKIDAPTRGQLAAQLGRVYLSSYQLDDAHEWLTRAHELQSKVLGPDYPDTLRTQLDLAAEARERARFGEAEQLARQALDGLVTALGNDHPWVADARQLVSSIALELGDCPEAVKQADAARDALDACFGPQHPDAVTACLQAAITATKCRGNGVDNAAIEKAQADARQRVEQLSKTLGPQDYRVLVGRLYLADMTAETPGQEEEALKAYTDLDAAYAQNRAYDACHPDVLKLQLGRGRLLLNLDRPAESESVVKSVLARCAARNPNEPQIAWLWECLGNAQAALKKPDEAKESYREAYRILLRIYGREHPEVQRFLKRLSAQ